MQDSTPKKDKLIRIQEATKFDPEELEDQGPTPVDRVVQYEESPSFDTMADGVQNDENATHVEKSYEDGEEKWVEKE